METVDKFLTFFNGIYADYDGAYGDQCFDLANLYSRWIGGQRFLGATADLIFNQPGDFYKQIPNTLDYVPQKGDIILWNWPHVGIATGNNSDKNQFEVLEQNDPLNSNCHIKIYANYNGVIGALRPRQLPANTTQIITQGITDQTHIPQIENREVQAIRSELFDLRAQVPSLLATEESLQKQLDALEIGPQTASNTPPFIVSTSSPSQATKSSLLTTILSWFK